MHKLTPLVWKKVAKPAVPEVAGPVAEAAGDIGIPVAPEVAAVTKSPMVAYLEKFGIPMSANPMATPKETAIELLQRAAAVEHAFAIQYLYAAYSLQTDDATAKSWSMTLRQIAREEMGHLATVQNLLRLLGESPNVNRQAYPAPAHYDFERVLPPFSVRWLGDFVVAESPTGAMLPENLESELARVGMLYAHLAWIFQPSDDAVGPWGLSVNQGWPLGEHLAPHDFVDPGPLTGLLFQPSDWKIGSSGAIRVLAAGPFANVDAMRNGALAALHDVSAQGEGTEAQDNSHFQRLLPMYMAAVALTGSLPVRPVSVNPHTVSQASGDDGLITDPTAVKLAKLLNVRYKLMLTMIVQAANTNRSVMEGAGPLKQLLAGQWAREEMHAIHALSDALLTLPLKDGGAANGPRASAPFELPDVLPLTEADIWAFYRDAIQGFANMTDSLLGSFPELKPIRDSDALRVAVIQHHLHP